MKAENRNKKKQLRLSSLESITALICFVASNPFARPKNPSYISEPIFAQEILKIGIYLNVTVAICRFVPLQADRLIMSLINVSVASSCMLDKAVITIMLDGYPDNCLVQ